MNSNSQRQINALHAHRQFDDDFCFTEAISSANKHHQLLLREEDNKAVELKPSTLGSRSRDRRGTSRTKPSWDFPTTVPKPSTLARTEPPLPSPPLARSPKVPLSASHPPVRLMPLNFGVGGTESSATAKATTPGKDLRQEVDRSPDPSFAKRSHPYNSEAGFIRDRHGREPEVARPPMEIGPFRVPLGSASASPGVFTTRRLESDFMAKSTPPPSPTLRPKLLTPPTLSASHANSGSPSGLFRDSPLINGVSNIGNTCYAGAVLALLLYNRRFLNGLRSFVASMKLRSPLRESKFEVHRALCNLSVAINDSRARYVSPIELQTAMGKFFDDHQHDAHEFALLLFDMLEREAGDANARDSGKSAVGCKRSRSPGETPPVPTPPPPPAAAPSTLAGSTGEQNVWIRQLFAGSVLQTVTCMPPEGCNHKFDSLESLIISSVPIIAVGRNADDDPVSAYPQPIATLSQMLAYSLRDSKVDGYKCEVCGKGETVWHRGVLLLPMPPLLLFHVMRFSTRWEDNAFTFNKNHSPVRFDETLTVRAFAVRKDEDPSLTRRGEEAINESIPETEARPLAGESGTDPPTRVILGDATSKRYRLVGLVRHLGSTPLAGHYVAEVMSPCSPAGNQPPRWLRFNDSHVEHIPQHSHGQSTDGYLALYEADHVEDATQKEEEECESQSTAVATPTKADDGVSSSTSSTTLDVTQEQEPNEADASGINGVDAEQFLLP